MTLNLTWIRIFTNIGRAGAFLAIGIVLVWVLTHWREIGHRLLLLFGAVVCLDITVASACNAYDIFRGAPQLAVWVKAGSALLSLLFAVHFIVSKDDMMTTLRTSEAEDRLRKDKAADQEQARLQIAYLAVQTLQRSEALVQERQANCG